MPDARWRICSWETPDEEFPFSVMASNRGGTNGELTDEKPRTVNIFVDEAAEVVNTPFLQILNKGRGAHLNGPLFSFRKEEMLDCYAGSVLKTDVLLKLIAASFELIGESYSSSLRRITDFRSGARTMEISDGSVFSTWMPSTSCLLCSSASACAFAGPERS